MVAEKPIIALPATPPAASRPRSGSPAQRAPPPEWARRRPASRQPDGRRPRPQLSPRPGAGLVPGGGPLRGAARLSGDGEGAAAPTEGRYSEARSFFPPQQGLEQCSGSPGPPCCSLDPSLLHSLWGSCYGCQIFTTPWPASSAVTGLSGRRLLPTQFVSPRDGGEGTSVPGVDGSWGLKIPFCGSHR